MKLFKHKKSSSSPPKNGAVKNSHTSGNGNGNGNGNRNGDRKEVKRSSSFFGNFKHKQKSKSSSRSNGNNNNNNTNVDVAIEASSSLPLPSSVSSPTSRRMHSALTTSTTTTSTAATTNPFDDIDINNGDDRTTSSHTSATATSTATPPQSQTQSQSPWQLSPQSSSSQSQSSSSTTNSRSNEKEILLPFDEGNMRINVSMKTLQIIMKYLEDKERNEWADDYENNVVDEDVADASDADADAATSDADADAATSDADAVNLDLFLRRTVDCMEEESQDIEIQRTGSRIIYLIYRLKLKQNKKNKKQQTVTRSYDSGNDDEELLIDVVEAILHAMEDFPDDELVQEDSCLALEAMTTSSCTMPTINDEVVMHRLFEEILVAMAGLADNSIVVSSSFGLLSNLSSSTAISTTMNSSKSSSSFMKNPKSMKYALSSILQGMKEHKNNVALYSKGYQALSNLTVGNYVAQQLLCCKEPLGLRILSEGLRCNTDQEMEAEADVQLQRLKMRAAATKVIKHLSTHPSLEVTGKIVLGNGSAAHILDRLLENLEHTSIHFMTMKSSSSSGGGDPNRNSTNTDPETHEQIIRVLVQTMDDILQTVENLADIEAVVTPDKQENVHHNHSPTNTNYTNNSNNHNTNRSSATDIQTQLAKVVKPVLTIFRQQHSSSNIQLYALSTLQRLTIRHANAIANEQGGLSTLFNTLSSVALSSSSSCILIHERVLGCVTGLVAPTSNADGLDLVANFQNEDGVTTLFQCIRQQYQLQLSLVEQSFEVLFYLTCRVRVILSSLTTNTICTTTQPHSGVGVGAEAAFSIKDQLILEENVFVLLGTMNQYTSMVDCHSELLCQRGLGILVNIYFFIVDSQQQTQQQTQQLQHTPDFFATDGGIPLLLHVMRRHGLVVAIQEYGVALLASILKTTITNQTKNSSAVCHEFVEEEGISTVLAAMMIHPKNHGAIQVHGFGVLIYLLTNENNQKSSRNHNRNHRNRKEYKRCILEETNTVQVVKEAMLQHPTNKRIQQRGATLLTLLSSSTSLSSSSTSTLPTKMPKLLTTSLPQLLLSSASQVHRSSSSLFSTSS